MSLNGDRVIQVLGAILVISAVANARPQSQQTYLPPSGQYQQNIPNNRQTFYVPSAQQQQQQQQPSASLSSQQQFLAQQPIQLQIPIPNDGVEEKKIYVQLPPQQHYPQQQPQYRYPPRKHYKIILVRSPPQPTPPPVPVLPEVEEQTLVYVLVKKPDTPSAAELEQLQQQQQQQSFKLNKPEVYFIKYKANEQQADGTPPAIPSEAIEKSIEQQLNNNLVGSGSGGGGYDYPRKRESKMLDQDESTKPQDNANQ